jgi:hypothetical protein
VVQHLARRCNAVDYIGLLPGSNSNPTTNPALHHSYSIASIASDTTLDEALACLNTIAFL